MPIDPPRFADPPSAPRKKVVGGIREVDLPSVPDVQEGELSSLTPDGSDDLSDLFPSEERARNIVSGQIRGGELPPGETILINIVTDGFTASGQVWYRGQEIEYVVGEQAFDDTKDRFGVSWLMCDDTAQMKLWGQVMFRRGPWPGDEYDDPRAVVAERSRARKPKALAGIAPPRQR